MNGRTCGPVCPRTWSPSYRKLSVPVLPVKQPTLFAIVSVPIVVARRNTVAPIPRLLIDTAIGHLRLMLPMRPGRSSGYCFVPGFLNRLRYHHRRENCRSVGSCRDGCNSRNARGQTMNSSGVSSSAGSPSIRTGMETVSVVIVCCVVGHAATNARPLTSRPVPRTSLASSGRCAPGRPTRYTHTCPRQDEDAAPDRVRCPGECRQVVWPHSSSGDCQVSIGRVIVPGAGIATS